MYGTHVFTCVNTLTTFANVTSSIAEIRVDFFFSFSAVGNACGRCVWHFVILLCRIAENILHLNCGLSTHSALCNMCMRRAAIVEKNRGSEVFNNYVLAFWGQIKWWALSSDYKYARSPHFRVFICLFMMLEWSTRLPICLFRPLNDVPIYILFTRCVVKSFMWLLLVMGKSTTHIHTYIYTSISDWTSLTTNSGQINYLSLKRHAVPSPKR